MCKICPNCGAIAEYNAYYGRTTCTRCSWESKKTKVLFPPYVAKTLKKVTPKKTNVVQRCETPQKDSQRLRPGTYPFPRPAPHLRNAGSAERSGY